MKKTLTSLFCLFCTLMVFATTENLQSPLACFSRSSESHRGMELSFTLPTYNLSTESIGGKVYQHINLPGAGMLTEMGLPELPIVTTTLAIPARGEVSLEVLSCSEKTLINYLPYPAQLNSESETPKNLVINDVFYNAGGLYPESMVELSIPQILRDMRIITIQVNPFAFNAQTGELIVRENIRIKVNFSTLVGDNELLSEPSELSPAFARIYESSIDNFETYRTLINHTVPPRYLIIYGASTDEIYLSALQDFALWKRQKGALVDLVSTTVAGTSTTNLKLYIQAQYNNPATRPDYIILIGDTTGSFPIPTFTVYSGSSDYPYTLLAGGDLLGDAFIGRISVEDVSSLLVVLNKIYLYERDIDLNNASWLNSGLLVGDWDPSGISTMYINQYIKEAALRVNPDYSFTELYSSAPSATSMNNAINMGIGVFNFRGYIDLAGWSPGASLFNGYKLPHTALITCSTGNFGTGLAKAESFIRLGSMASPAGAVTAIGMATASNHTTFNNCLDGGIFGGIYNHNMRTMGEALLAGKVHIKNVFGVSAPSSANSHAHWCNLMGDPTMEVFTGIPGQFIIQAPPSIPQGQRFLSLTVSDSLGPREGAWITLTSEQEIIAKGYTDSEGKTIMELPEDLTLGNKKLTVSRHDFKPTQIVIPVLNAGDLIASDVIVDDDNLGSSSGNGDGAINAGETLELLFGLQNVGTETIRGITGTLSCSNPQVHIDNAAIAYADIAPGSSLQPQNPIVLSIGFSAPDGLAIPYEINLSDALANSYSIQGILQVNSASFVVNSLIPDDGEDGWLDPGESCLATVSITNVGNADLSSLYGKLYSLNNVVSISDFTAFFGSVAMGATTTNLTDNFALQAANEVLPGMTIPMRLDLYTAAGFAQSICFNLSLGAGTLHDPLGPDEYGYVIYDDQDTGYPECPVYNWIEISPLAGGLGTALPIADAYTSADEGDQVGAVSLAVVDLPFPFKFYGIEYSQITVCSNGFLALGVTQNAEFRNYRLPGRMGPSPMIAPFWDDLATRAGSDISTWYDSANHLFIIEWKDLINGHNGTSLETFQCILYDQVYHQSSLGDGSIKIQYHTFNNVDSQSGMNHGNYATIGVEDHTAVRGLEYSFNNIYPTTAAALGNGRALYITTAPFEEPPTIPDHVSLVSPLNGSTYLDPYNTTLTWMPSSSGGGSDINNIYLSNSPDSLIAGYHYTTPENFIVLPSEVLGYNRNWYWTVIPENSYGSPAWYEPGHQIWSFSTCPKLSISPNTISFSAQYIPTTETKQILIKNFSQNPIDLSSITLTGSSYYRTSYRGLRHSLDPGDTLEVTVSYSPLEVGTHQATLTIISDMPSTTEIAISGAAILRPNPYIALNPNPLEHTMQEQSLSYRTVDISNYGLPALTYSINTAGFPTWLTISSENGSVNSLQISPLTLYFNSSGLSPHPAGSTYADAYVDTVFIQTNDPLHSVYELIVRLLVRAHPISIDFAGTPVNGSAPLEVQFSDLSTIDTDQVEANLIEWRWDFDNDGIIDSWLQNPTYTYQQPGTYSVKLSVVADTGSMRTLIKPDYISVVNHPPSVANPLPLINDMQEDTLWGPHPLFVSVEHPDGLFSDPDGQPLTIFPTNSTHLQVSISNGQFYIHPSQDWHGTELICLKAIDPYGLFIEQQIAVTVNSINDPPVLALLPDFYFIKNSHFIIDFTNHIADPDNDYSDLSITITPSDSTDNISIAYLPVNLPSLQGQLSAVFAAEENWTGTEAFSFIVNDNENRAIAVGSFNLTVLDHFTVALTADSGSSLPVAYAGQTVYFRDLTLGNPDWWAWEIRRNGEVIFTSNLQNPVLTLNDPGIYGAALMLGNTEAQEQAVEINIDLFTLAGTAVDSTYIPTNWTPMGSPYNLYWGVGIPADQTVNIQEGVVVNVFTTEPMEVAGVINAENVVFQPQTNSGFWGGFIFSNSGSRPVSTIANCDIRDAEVPLQIISSSPLITNTTISVSDTTVVINNPGILIQGNASPVLTNLTINNYTHGVIIDSGNVNPSGCPQLSNLSIRCHSNLRNNTSEFVGVDLRNACNAQLDSVIVYDSTIGLKIENQSLAQVSTPTLSNVRIRNSSSSIRSTRYGLIVRGNCLINVDDLEIENTVIGLMMQDVLANNSTSSTLTNVRIRNSSSSIRSVSTGLILENSPKVTLSDCEITNFDTGISMLDTGLGITSTPQLSGFNIITNPATRQEAVGIVALGKIALNLSNTTISNYHYGLKYNSQGKDLNQAIPIITGISIVNQNPNRLQTSIGIQLNNIRKITLSNSSIEGYHLGVEILNQIGSSILYPTLSNLTINNFLDSDRSENIGIYLGAIVQGSLRNSTITGAGVGLLVADGNKSSLEYNIIKNCISGIKASGSETPLPLQHQIMILESDFYNQNPGVQFSAFELNYAGPWSIKNNTILGYPTGIKCSAANVIFQNNIIWNDPPLPVAPFMPTNSNLFISYNDISYTNGIYPGLGNINLNPCFQAPESLIFALHYNSPCIDGGNPQTLDLDGSPSDIGAYTYLHRAQAHASERFVQTGSIVQFTNESWGHDYPESLVAWDLNDDGIIEATSLNWTCQFNTPGIYNLRLIMSTGNLVDSRLYQAVVLVQDTHLQAPQNIALSVMNGNVQLTWDPVTQTIDNLPAEVSFYIIYHAPSPSGYFDYLSFTEQGQTSFEHLQGAMQDMHFYIIIGFSTSRSGFENFIKTHPKIWVD